MLVKCEHLLSHRDIWFQGPSRPLVATCAGKTATKGLYSSRPLVEDTPQPETHIEDVKIGAEGQGYTVVQVFYPIADYTAPLRALNPSWLSMTTYTLEHFLFRYHGLSSSHFDHHPVC
ncbi:hypothetical protein PM082_024440 [Marasmius tenuissimus]|nr:hypothetical protein PM082_024440 [Marasmius tenuissimus]